MHPAPLLTIVMLGAGGPAALAADACDDPPDQASLSACAAQELQAADAELNRRFRQIEQLLDEDTAGRELFVTAQRAWIGFRDAECAFQASGVEGGSIYPMIHANCLTSLTNARLADFAAYLSCEEGDMSCPVPGR